MPFTLLDSSTAATAPATTAGNPLTSIGETLLSLQTELLSDLLGRADVGTLRQTKWINWGYINVAQMLDLSELWGSVAIAAVANQPFYLLPTQLSWIRRLALEDPTDFVNTGGKELDLIDEPTYRQLPDTSVFTGESPIIPESYFRWGRMLVLWPTPSQNFTLNLDFRVRPVKLVNPTDSPILPEEFHEVILYAALERAWRALRVPQAALAAMNDKLSVLRPLLNTDAEERSAMHVTLTPVRSHWQLMNRRRP
jgi:hypothetical protein